MGDLVLGHAGAFSRAKGLFLFLTPFIDIMEVLGVTARVLATILTRIGPANGTHI